jgi:hypothetical protein
MTAEQLRAERDEALANGLEWSGVVEDGVNACRPCPWVSCRYHLEHEIESCALDVADKGAKTLQEVAGYLGVSFQRVAYIEERAVRRLKQGG